MLKRHSKDFFIQPLIINVKLLAGIDDIHCGYIRL